MKRGEIYYVEPIVAAGSEQRGDRPAIIVSNDKNNRFGRTVEVVYLTTQPKTDLPTHVTVCGTGTRSVALCEQITTVAKERVKELRGVCSQEEMKALERALCISLGIVLTKRKETET